MTNVWDEEGGGGQDGTAEGAARSRVERAREVAERIAVLGRAAGAVDLRLCRILAWFRHQDHSPLGYSTYSAFRDEEVDLGATWESGLVGLADSPLNLVKDALARGLIPISVAVRAPRETDPEGEAAWVRAAIEGDLAPVPRCRSVPEVLIDGDVMREVHEARELARTMMGRPASDAAADAHVLQAWRHRLTNEEMLEQALTPGLRPGAEVPGWPPFDDPADALLGPWREPEGLEDGFAALAAVLDARRWRIIELGRLYTRLVERRYYLDLGFPSAKAFALRTIPVSPRTLQRYAAQARALDLHPALVDSVADGTLGLDRALLVAGISTAETVADWITIARRTGQRELRAAVAFAQEVSEREVIDAYLAALAEATDRVALRAAQRPPRAPRNDLVHPDLPEAARWFLATVQLPPQTGFGRVKERDRFTCANPECRRRTLRIHAHHVVWRSQGGTDDPGNGIAVCIPCHLRLIHTGIVTVRPDGHALIWTYPGREIRVV